MTRARRLAVIAVWLLGGAIASTPSRAQGDPSSPAPPPAGARDHGAIAERMRDLFAARLKRDVGLDDSQIQAVLPRIERLERERARIQRERGSTLRGLRQGLDAGVPDKELQQQLDRLDRLAGDLQRATGDELHGIDALLTVPQRVRIRFLLVRFRAEMKERIREMRRGGAGPNRR
jgi:hypothetical protein